MTHHEEHCQCSPFKNTAGQSTSMQCLSGTMQQVPTDFEDHAVTGGVSMKGRCGSCSVFFVLWICFVHKICQRCNVARSNKFLFICSHQDPLMIDWYREGLNLWPCLNPSLEPGWLGNWSHKDTATPQHWLFSRQGTVRSMLIPCRPTAYTVPRRACRSDQQREDRA